MHHRVRGQVHDGPGQAVLGRAEAVVQDRPGAGVLGGAGGEVYERARLQDRLGGAVPQGLPNGLRRAGGEVAGHGRQLEDGQEVGQET